ncbi:MAG: hypothetical protein Q7J60_18870 [Bradyrhizobium sp.]|nr:hypothetical protein [Bradyrhizobium sp.]
MSTELNRQRASLPVSEIRALRGSDLPRPQDILQPDIRNVDPISPGVTFTLLVGGVIVSMWKVEERGSPGTGRRPALSATARRSGRRRFP